MTPNLKFLRFPRTDWPMLVLLGLSLLILLPRLLSPSFGLLDDGRTLTVAHQITQGQWRVDFDLDAGRFRPVYWTYYALLYRLADAHPLGWFVGKPGSPEPGGGTSSTVGGSALRPTRSGVAGGGPLRAFRARHRECVHPLQERTFTGGADPGRAEPA
ncbi:hypothetical protein SE15_12790 [Thermanaerothrix daxensis]|uniref:Uncharacterized protein n=1 Tax=Thermanaerothrix daxensis TaxID=869279 RepID=A0A0P6XS79_9CHLR|nr:hypothetical protein [Thermanaerothrix daxensis]KPL82006.1 hypothetical protein SE15_12790 [Thermanaerothrix daxensis]